MNIRLLLQDCHDRIQGGARASEWFLPFSVESAWGPPSLSRLSHDSLTLAFCLATRRCMNLDPSFLSLCTPAERRVSKPTKCSSLRCLCFSGSRSYRVKLGTPKGHPSKSKAGKNLDALA